MALTLAHSSISMGSAASAPSATLLTPASTRAQVPALPQAASGRHRADKPAEAPPPGTSCAKAPPACCQVAALASACGACGGHPAPTLSGCEAVFGTCVPGGVPGYSPTPGAPLSALPSACTGCMPCGGAAEGQAALASACLPAAPSAGQARPAVAASPGAAAAAVCAWRASRRCRFSSSTAASSCRAAVLLYASSTTSCAAEFYTCML